MPPEVDEKSPRTRHPYLRYWLYAIAFSLAFALAVSELGLSSTELARGGTSYANYPGTEYKNDLGLLLFTSIAEILFVISHFWISVSSSAFITFILAVLWGTGAGILWAVTPFRATNCGNPLSTSSFTWQRLTGRCELIVAMQAIAWTLWGLHVLMFFGMLRHLLDIRVRRNAAFYRV